MTESVVSLTEDLPQPERRILDEFVEAARAAFGPDLHSVVLFGSAAEGALRPTSDINLILVTRPAAINTSPPGSPRSSKRSTWTCCSTCTTFMPTR